MVQGAGGSVMVWGAFHGETVLPLQQINCILNSQQYTNVLQGGLLPHYQQEIIFQQDNAQCHVSRLTLNWLQYHQVSVMDWPAQSPDLNPIKHLWSELKHQLDQVKIQNQEQLFQTASQLWREMAPNTLQ